MPPAENADLASVLQPVLEAAIKLQRADFGDIALYDPDRLLRIVVHQGVGEEFLEHFGCIDANDASAGRGPLNARDRVIIEDVNDYAPYAPYLAVAAATGYRGLSCTPLTERGTGLALGMITTLFREPYRPDEARLRWSEVFAHQAADLVSCRRARQEFGENEEFLRRALEGGRMMSAAELAGLGLYSLRMQGGKSHLTWDDRVRNMWGLPKGANVTFQVWLNGIHPEDRARVEAAVVRAYDPEGDGLCDVEYRVLGADGVERWVATRGETRFEKGQPVFFLGVALDITNRKVIEHGLALVLEMRDCELREVSATLEAETKARRRVSKRLELLQSELSRGLFAALERGQSGSPAPRDRRVADATLKIAALYPREREVLDGLVAGEPHKQIAHRLGISVRTVELHRARMLHRLGPPHLAEAIRIAVLAELAAD